MSLGVHAAVVFTTLLIGASWSADLYFPPGFKFGAGTSSYQIEGAWNVSDKSESIWDRHTHDKPHMIDKGSSGDVACDSYHLWRRDVAIAKEMGLHFYRFSISWPRLLPTGFSNVISEDGKRYYNELIDGLLENGIEPVVTMYHWDLPQRLQDLGGWTNPLIADWFADYARVLYTLYGDRVQTWLTINEMISICSLGYSWGILAPGVRDPDVGYYICNKNVLLAHAKAWRVYDEEFRGKFRGKVSLTQQMLWLEGATEQDEELAETIRQHMNGKYLHPIFSEEGGWPPVIEKYLAEKSKREGYPWSRLPTFSKEEKELIRGTHDFLGLNFYTSRLVRGHRAGDRALPWPLGAPEFNAVFDVDPRWGTGSSPWFYIYPEGLRKLLNWLKTSYHNPEIMIMENGYSSKGYNLEDFERIQYYKDHLEQILLSINEDGVNVTRYTAWSLMDNFEWHDGYEKKFGLYEVEFESAARVRTPRLSAKYYGDVIKAHSLHVDLPTPKRNDEL